MTNICFIPHHCFFVIDRSLSQYIACFSSNDPRISVSSSLFCLPASFSCDKNVDFDCSFSPSRCLCSLSKIAGKGSSIVEYLIHIFFKHLQGSGSDNMQVTIFSLVAKLNLQFFFTMP